MKVFLQDNLWFTENGANYVLNGKDMIPFEPLLGRTDSFDSNIKRIELRWVKRFLGQDVIIAQEWFEPNSRVDFNLKNSWLPVFEKKMPCAEWCIFFDPVIAAKRAGFGDPPHDWSDPELMVVWNRAINYLRKEYFDHPQYWRVDGKPVLYVWAVHGGTQNAANLFRSSGCLILGDVFGTFDNFRANGIDVATGFVSKLPSMLRKNLDYFESWNQIKEECKRWKRLGYRVVPAASLQYDDWAFMDARGQGEPPSRVLAPNRQAIVDVIKTLIPFCDLGVIGLGTLNNWAEGTTVLPTEGEESYSTTQITPYSWGHLKAIREALKPEPYQPSRPEKPDFLEV